MSAVVKKNRIKNTVRTKSPGAVSDELALKMFDMLVREELINPDDFTIEELELLLTEVFIDIKRRFEIIQ